jgi:hypothetical protein
MPSSTVIAFSENTATMTFAQGLAFIERTRRQLDRFDDALPHAPGKSMDPGDVTLIRRSCDELEADITRLLSHI